LSAERQRRRGRQPPIRRRDADAAEEIARREVTNAGAEITRILREDQPASNAG